MSERKAIPAKTERLLWGIAAGRCEFEGCNKVLYRHEISGASENLAEKAHIHAVSNGGARFDTDIEEDINNVNNLMLVCPQCHIIIDRNEQKYSPDVLYKMKEKHEKRIYTLTNIGDEFRCHMVYFTANIAGSSIIISDGDARNALASFGRYPSDISPIDLGKKGDLTQDNEEDFYTENVKNLRRAFNARITDIISDGESIALFALAPQPLLMYIGTLFNDKYNVSVFQPHRRDKDKWRWDNSLSKVDFITKIPQSESETAEIALVFSLSSTIKPERITSVLGSDVLLYSITIESPNRDFVTHPAIMEAFVSSSRKIMEDIKQKYGKDKVIHVFPAMPSSLAIRFGMDRMPKSDNKLIIYDEHEENGFVRALTIGGDYD